MEFRHIHPEGYVAINSLLEIELYSILHQI